MPVASASASHQHAQTTAPAGDWYFPKNGKIKQGNNTPTN